MGNLRKIKKSREKNWVNTEKGRVLSEKAAEGFVNIFKPSSEEVMMNEATIERRCAEGKWSKGKDGNYYPTERSASLLCDALRD